MFFNKLNYVEEEKKLSCCRKRMNEWREKEMEEEGGRMECKIIKKMYEKIVECSSTMATRSLKR